MLKILASLALLSVSAYAGPIASGGTAKSEAQKSVDEFAAINQNLRDGQLGRLMFHGGERVDGAQFMDFGAVVSIRYLNQRPGIAVYQVILGTSENPRCLTNVELQSDWDTPDVVVKSVGKCQVPSQAQNQSPK